MNVPCLRFARKTLLVLAVASLATPALAVCPVCNGAVRFDRSLAACFQKRVDSEIRRLESEGRGFIIVDLSDCEKEDGRGVGLPTDSKAIAAPLDASFVADAGALRCLGDAIARHSGELDPSVVFDLTKICS